VEQQGDDMVNYVYLKLGAGYNGSEDAITNIIPLKVTTVTINTAKTIPNVPVPFSGLLTGESVNVALDMGMSNKRISLGGFILESQITKRFGKKETAKTRTFTAIEIAQMIHSSVDSTGIQPQQAVNELIFLYDSKVDKDYYQRPDNPDDDRTGTEELVPFNWHSRGDRGKLDNLGAILSQDFPDNEYSEGILGYIESFNTVIDSTTIDISFTLEFAVAKVFPNGAIATTIADAIS
jgi:hypothetical protein